MEKMRSRFFKTLVILLISILNKRSNAFPIFPIFPTSINNCASASGFFGDSADVAAGFAGGTKTNVTWDGTKLVLSAGQLTGTFTSRVIDNECLASKPWVDLQWTSTLPYYKEIPVTSESSTAYSAKTANLMTGIIGLWRFNESGSYTGATGEMVDSSGNARHGERTGTGGTTTTGLFNRALSPTPGSTTMRVHSSVIGANHNTFSFSIWYKGNGTLTNWPALVYRGSASSPTWAIRIDQNASFHGAPYFESNTSGSFQQVYTNHATQNDGKWHHVGLVVTNGSVSLFVDGTKYTGTYTFGSGYTGTGNHMHFCDSPPGYCDEAAYWSRALSDAEMIELYRRGGNRTKFQIRVCPDSTCSTNPTWRGPDNTASTYFTEINNNSNQATGLGTVQTTAPVILYSNFPSIVLTQRYFQYRVILERDTTTYSPDIKTAGPGR